MTDMKIDVSFDTRVPLSHVSGSSIQKEKVKQAGKKTLGVTKPTVALTEPEMHWLQEHDPIRDTYFLTLKGVKARVTFSTSVRIDKAIDRKSDCYKHVRGHELRHVKIWQAGVKAAAPQINKRLATLAKEVAPAGAEMTKAETAEYRQGVFDRMRKALHEAVLEHGKAISKKSQAIHTKAELKETNLTCPAYL